jgi:hypothetical protein
MAACAEVSPELVSRLQSRLPRVTGNLQESIGFKVGMFEGHAYTVIGAASEYEASVGGRDVRPLTYLDRVDELHGHWMKTALTDDDVDNLAAEVGKAIEQVLNGTVSASR